MSKRIIRVLSMVLTLVMMLSLSTPAFAWGGIDTGKGWDRQIGEDDFREIEPAEEAEEEEVYDYFQTSGEGGYQVTVEAPMGSLPMLAELRAEPVEIEEIREAVESVVDGEANILVALDISFWMNGIEIEPEEAVRVKISAPELLDKTNLSVVHIPDGEEPEKVNLVDEEGLSFALGANEVAFEADSFSVYVVVDDGQTDENARLHVHFKQADGSDVEILVKKTDMKTEPIDGVEVNHFEQVLYDPGVGAIAEGKMFRGWTTVENYDKDTPTKTIEDVRTEVAALLNAGVTEGQEITYYPVILNARYVSYLDELGASIKNDLILFKDDETVTYTVNQVYTPREQDSRFDGWGVATKNEETGKYSVTGTVYANNATIDFTKDSESLVLMASVPKGHWLIFKENARGATYTAPQFILSEGTTTKPANPQCQGYDFDDWYYGEEDEQGHVTLGAKFTAWNQKLDETTTLYANWNVASSADYTVIIWKQQVEGDKYDFSQSIRISGTPNTTVNTISARNTGNTDVRDDYARINGVDYRGVVDADHDYTGFHLASFDQNVNIAPQGSTVVNVYYDRNMYTYTFYVANPDNLSNWNSGYTRESDDTTYRISNRNNATSVQTVTRRYQASIKDIWEFTGSDGQTYPRTRRYDNKSFRSSWSATGYAAARVSHLETMEAEDRNYYVIYTSRDIRNLNYYVEAVGGETGEKRTFGGKTYVEYYPLECDFNYVVYNIDVWQLDGFKFEAIATNAGTNVTNPIKNAGDNGLPWTSSTGTSLNGTYNANSTLYFYYSRDKFPITYFDGIYVDKDGNPIDEQNRGLLHKGDDILYEASLKDHANDYQPTYTGYVLEGWYLDDACTQKFDFENSTMPKGGVNLYAKWRIVQYRVFLHPNVTKTEDPNFSMGGAATSFALNYGENVTEPTAIRDEYEIVGWYRDEAFTDAWNFSAYVGNDTNITTEYAKTEETELTSPYATVEPGKEGYNKDADLNRFWITRKLDLYAKWRLKLTGAEGIQVYYDAVAGTGEGTGAFADGSTLLYDPVGYYTDEAVSKAQGASTANAENEEFKYWVIQKWDADTEEYVDVIGDDGEPMKVYPGGDFTVKKVYCREENIDGADPATDIYYLTYKMHLRAEYGSIEAPTPTHINWYSNLMDVAGLEMKLDNFGGTKTESVNEKGWVVKDRIVNGEDDLGINEAIDIRPADTYSYQGYTFLGWAKIASDKKPDAENPLTEADLFLKWDPDFKYTVEGETKKGAFLAKDDSGNFTVRATKVAADENQPYDDLYAVWKGVFYVYHSGVEGGNIETFDLTAETKSFDLTNTPEGLTEGTLYGGYYLEGGFRATAASSGDGETGELDDGEGGSTISTAPSYAAYDGTNWTWTTPVRTEAGNAITPVAGTTYYIKEVPADKYLQPYLHYTYKWNDGTITASWLISNVDDAKYKETGFLVISMAEDKAKVCNSLTVQNTGTQQTSIKLTTELVFNVTGGYLTYLPVMDANGAIASTGYDANCTIKQYWITPDGLAVTSANARTYVTIDSHYTIDKDAVDLDTVTAKSNIYTLADWQKSVPAC